MFAFGQLNRCRRKGSRWRCPRYRGTRVIAPATRQRRALVQTMSKREEILSAAVALFAAKGFRDTTMGEVAGRVGAAASTVFYHFKTKEDIFLAILDRLEHDIGQAIQAHEQQLRNRPVKGIEHVLAAVDFLLRLAGSHTEIFLILHHRFPYELAAANSACRRQLEEIHNRFTRLFEEAVRRGQAEGGVIPGDPRRIAMVLFALVDGIIKVHTFHLYEAGALYNEALALTRRMLKKEPHPP